MFIFIPVNIYAQSNLLLLEWDANDEWNTLNTQYLYLVFFICNIYSDIL